MASAAPITNPTLLDLAKQTDPDGNIARIAELLNQKNDLLSYLPFMEGNLSTGHQASVRTGLPTASYRQINAGSQMSKSTVAQLVEQCAIMDEFSEVDVKLARMAKNIGLFRINESKAKIEAMQQKFARTFWYGNSGVVKEEFDGLSPRYSDSTAANGSHIVKGGGTTNGQNASIWVLGLEADSTIFGIYPKGSTQGLQHEDKDIVTVENANGVAGARLDVYRDKFSWDHGIVVKDWRYGVRVPNIDIPALIANATPADIQLLVFKALERIQDTNTGRLVICCNRTVRQMWGIQNRAAVGAGGGLTWETVDGKRVRMFEGIPVIISDQLLETEDVVS